MNDHDLRKRLYEAKRRLYHSYLHSDEWLRKREMILRRDVVCQVCKVNKAGEVHHLSYRHLFHESQYELLGVCGECHRRLSKLKGNRDE